LDNIKLWRQKNFGMDKDIQNQTIIYLPRFLLHSGKKFGEHWSINYEDLDVELYPLKLTISEDHILALKGCCSPKFLYMLENDHAC